MSNDTKAAPVSTSDTTEALHTILGPCEHDIRMVYCGPYGAPEPDYYACMLCDYRPTDDELLIHGPWMLRLDRVKAIGREYAEKCDRLEAEVAALQNTIEAVRALHRWNGDPDTSLATRCGMCNEVWPCATIVALDGVEAVPALSGGERCGPI